MRPAKSYGSQSRFRFIRKRQNADATRESEASVLFIRATNDLPSQLARRLFDFCSERLTLERATPAGRRVTVDLPAILETCVNAKLANWCALRMAFEKSPKLMGKLLSELSDRLPYGLVLVIDQGEEVFTLAADKEDAENGELGLKLLGFAADTPGDFKQIISMRTEYYGRIANRIEGVANRRSVGSYLLMDFSKEQLVAAIELPTCKTSIDYTSEIPREKYQFQYDGGVADVIATEAIRVCSKTDDSVLPLVQIICTQLYENVKARGKESDGVIRRADFFHGIGGVEGGLRSHAEALVSRLMREISSRSFASEIKTKMRMPNAVAALGRTKRLPDISAFKAVCKRLYQRQPDGAVTTALSPKSELASHWKGDVPFERLLDVATREEYRLLRVTPLALRGKSDQDFVSLGHDALAPVAAAWHLDLKKLRVG